MRYAGCMEQRPNTVLGLVRHYVRMKWGGLTGTHKLFLAIAVVVAAFAVGSYAQCMMRASCPASGGCPYSQGDCDR